MEIEVSEELNNLFDSIVNEATSVIEAANTIEAPAYIADDGRFVSNAEYLLELYEKALFEAYEDDDEDVTTEGATFDSMKILHKFKKEQKQMKKIVKKAIKDGRYEDAKKKLDYMSKLALDAYKEIDALDVDKVSVVCGAFLYSLQIAFESLILCLPIIAGGGALGAVVGGHVAGAMLGVGTAATLSTITVGLYKTIMEAIAMTKEIARSSKKDRDDKNDANYFKNKCKITVKKYQQSIKEMKKGIDEYAKFEKEEKDEKTKEEKIKKESTQEYQSIKHAYTAYNDGLITLDQREQIIHDIKVESVANSEIITTKYENNNGDEFDALEAADKFNRVRKNIYQKFFEGSITLDQREEMLSKARSIIMEASDKDKKQEEQKKIADSAQNTMNKDTDKVKSELEKTAAELTKGSK